MAGPLHFYLDLMSPFAYLAHTQLPGLARRHGLDVVYHPVNLPQLKLAAGNTGPSNVTIPIKLRYLLTDLRRWADRYGVPLAFPTSLDSALANKAVLYAADRGQAEPYVTAMWHAVWGAGGDPREPALLARVAAAMGWDAPEVAAFVASPEAERRYAESTKGANARGVFGVPTMVLGDEMWWGNDRLPFLAEFLAASPPHQTDRTEPCGQISGHVQ